MHKQALTGGTTKNGSSFTLPLGLDTLRSVDCSFHNAILGILLYGSHARGDATSRSDIDILVVLDSSVLIQRVLYAEIDSYSGMDQRYSVMLSHLPEPEKRPSTLWLEVAQECVILSDQDHKIAKAITFLQGLIHEGKVLRKESHGQGYWVYAQ